MMRPTEAELKKVFHTKKDLNSAKWLFGYYVPTTDSGKKILETIINDFKAAVVIAKQQLLELTGYDTPIAVQHRKTTTKFIEMVEQGLAFNTKSLIDKLTALFDYPVRNILAATGGKVTLDGVVPPNTTYIDISNLDVNKDLPVSIHNNMIIAGIDKVLYGCEYSSSAREKLQIIKQLLDKEDTNKIIILVNMSEVDSSTSPARAIFDRCLKVAI